MFDTICPYCKYKATDHETLVTGEVPEDGDISFCISCGEACEFQNRSLIKLDEEKLEGNSKQAFNEVKEAWLKVRARDSVGEFRKRATGGTMNWLKRNMFGEINPICYLFGHTWCIYGSEKIAICMRCELNNKKFRNSETFLEEVKSE